MKYLQKYFKKVIKFEKIMKKEYFFFFNKIYMQNIYKNILRSIYYQNNKIYT